MPVSRFYNTFDTAALDETRARRSDDEYRSPFQIDRDRIVHSDAFRRLQWKTQVFHSFLVGEYDFYRSRLTHSLEVAQIGRAICGRLLSRGEPLHDEFQIDTDLVEAACLAHDLGHPPFGHTGERTLHQVMLPFGGFEGNAQTLRILCDTAFDGGRKGMNPTRALLDAVLKYKRLHRDAPDARNKYLYDEQKHVLDFVFPGDCLPANAATNSFQSIECQIMDWADDTAYSINDIADSVRSQMLGIGQLESWAGQQQLTTEETEHIEDLLRTIRSDRLEAILGRNIGDYIRACSLRRKSGPLPGLTQRHDFELVVDDSVRRRCALYKRLAFDIVFASPKLQQLDYKAGLILSRLFQALSENYVERDSPRLHLLPGPTEKLIAAAPDARSRARLVCDWLANLTDRAAFQQHQRMFDSASGSE